MERLKVRLLTRDIASRGRSWRKGNKQVVEPKRLQLPSVLKDHKDRTTTTHPRQQTHIPSVHNHDVSCHNNAPMIHAPLPFPMHSFLHVSYLYVFPPSLWLTWLTDPAPVTLVYPNWMQYTPRVLQEASLLDGVDAGVCGNGRRFSKTSSYPPCRRYALILLYPYFLMTSPSLCS